VSLWKNRDVLICVGTGGVGKTTVSASLAIAAATDGLNTLVMTIDPARRLADALGISDTGNTEHVIAPEVFAEHGVELKGSLTVSMLDVKSTFDDVMRRTAPDKETADQILANDFYQQFSSALSGALEYAAVEKLYEVYASGRFDLIIVDTPPSQNAIEFLHAPRKMLDFLDQGSIQWLLKSSAVAGKWSSRILDLGSVVVSKTLGKMAGLETVQQVVQFLVLMQGLYGGFRERYGAIEKLLRSDGLGFVLVASAQSEQLQAARDFRAQLEGERYEIEGMILNRVRASMVDTAMLEAIEPTTVEGEALLETLRDEARGDAHSRALVDELIAESGGVESQILHELSGDLDELAGLSHLQSVLRGGKA